MDQETEKLEIAINEGSITSLLHGSSGIDVRSAFTKDIYLVHQLIVGMRYQGGADDLVHDLKPGSRITFLREPDNKYDHRAVMAIDEQGRKIGYIPRHQNAIISALLDAGKSFYGIVADDRVTADDKIAGDDGIAANDHKKSVPGALWVELYMREYIGPEDLQQIPRQGEQGSYAVIYVGLTEEEPRQIRVIYAIKVINGEERGSFHEWLDNFKDMDAQKRLIKEFDHFVGMLPLVGHEIENEVEDLLADAYGVLLGKPFSNRTIDTGVMVRNHLPDLAGASLDEINDELGLYSGDAGGEELYCRMTWSLYRRMDRSELERRMNRSALRLTPLEELYRKHKMGAHAYSSLAKQGILLLGDVLDRSEKDLLALAQIRERDVEEIRHLLEQEKLSFSEEDYEEDTVRMHFPDKLEEFKEASYEALVSNMTYTQMQEMEELTEEERVIRINDFIDQKLELAQRKGNRSAYVSLLYLGASTGYRGDFSEAGFAVLQGLDGLDENITNGYLILALYYDACKNGKLRPEAQASMLKVCDTLGFATLEGDLLQGVEDQGIRTGAAGVLFRDAVYYSRYAPQTEETIDLLMTIGWMFFEGEAELEDGETVEMKKNPELAYKAFYYAEERGEPYAVEMKKRVLQECR